MSSSTITPTRRPRPQRQSSRRSSIQPEPRQESPWLGSTLILIAAAAYTASNVYLRRAAVAGDPVWMTCLKCLPVTLVACGLVARRAWLGLAWKPSRRALAALVSTGLVVQLVGNVPFQFALGEIGLALAVPLVFGTLISGGALFGRLWLGERLTVTSVVGMAILVGAIGVLSLAADEAHRAISGPSAAAARHVQGTFWGVLACCLAGAVYAANGAVIRRMVSGTVPVATTMWLISLTGAVSLGLWSLFRLGPAGLLGTPEALWWDMLGAGGFNAVAFCAFTSGMRHIGLIRGNALNSTQTAMAALAGVVFFGEPLTGVLVAGVGLTMIGLWLASSRAPHGPYDRK